MIRVERYAADRQPVWDAFVAGSVNGTFLFYRDYIDYHADRFTDHSLMVYDGDRLIALLPANIKGETLVSHGGLTYGGFVIDSHMKTPLMLLVFDAALTWCRERGLTGVRYKPMPAIYPSVPAQADLYALLLCGATITDRSVMSVICPAERLALPKGRRYMLNKARKHDLRVCHDDPNLASYWRLLEATLEARHDAHPVHSLAEIALLQRRFPQQIKLYACYEGSDLIAGVLVFESQRVARTQYIAANERGRELGALDLILDHLLSVAYADKPYFDFGTSHDPESGALNGGLIEQKESFGARAVMQDSYWIDLAGWQPDRLRGAVP